MHPNQTNPHEVELLQQLATSTAHNLSQTPTGLIQHVSVDRVKHYYLNIFIALRRQMFSYQFPSLHVGWDDGSFSIVLTPAHGSVNSLTITEDLRAAAYWFSLVLENSNVVSDWRNQTLSTLQLVQDNNFIPNAPQQPSLFHELSLQTTPDNRTIHSPSQNNAPIHSCLTDATANITPFVVTPQNDHQSITSHTSTLPLSRANTAATNQDLSIKHHTYPKSPSGFESSTSSGHLNSTTNTNTKTLSTTTPPPPPYQSLLLSVPLNIAAIESIIAQLQNNQTFSPFDDSFDPSHQYPTPSPVLRPTAHVNTPIQYGPMQTLLHFRKSTPSITSQIDLLPPHHSPSPSATLAQLLATSAQLPWVRPRPFQQLICHSLHLSHYFHSYLLSQRYVIIDAIAYMTGTVIVPYYHDTTTVLHNSKHYEFLLLGSFPQIQSALEHITFLYTCHQYESSASPPPSNSKMNSASHYRMLNIDFRAALNAVPAHDIHTASSPGDVVITEGRYEYSDAELDQLQIMFAHFFSNNPTSPLPTEHSQLFVQQFAHQQPPGVTIYRHFFRLVALRTRCHITFTRKTQMLTIIGASDYHVYAAFNDLCTIISQFYKYQQNGLTYTARSAIDDIFIQYIDSYYATITTSGTFDTSGNYVNSNYLSSTNDIYLLLTPNHIITTVLYSESILEYINTKIIIPNIKDEYLHNNSYKSFISTEHMDFLQGLGVAPPPPNPYLFEVFFAPHQHTNAANVFAVLHVILPAFVFNNVSAMKNDLYRFIYAIAMHTVDEIEPPRVIPGQSLVQLSAMMNPLPPLTPSNSTMNTNAAGFVPNEIATETSGLHTRSSSIPSAAHLQSSSPSHAHAPNISRSAYTHPNKPKDPQLSKFLDFHKKLDGTPSMAIAGIAGVGNAAKKIDNNNTPSLLQTNIVNTTPNSSSVGIASSSPPTNVQHLHHHHQQQLAQKNSNVAKSTTFPTSSGESTGNPNMPPHPPGLIPITNARYIQQHQHNRRNSQSDDVSGYVSFHGSHKYQHTVDIPSVMNNHSNGSTTGMFLSSSSRPFVPRELSNGSNTSNGNNPSVLSHIPTSPSTRSSLVGQQNMSQQNVQGQHLHHIPHPQQQQQQQQVIDQSLYPYLPPTQAPYQSQLTQNDFLGQAAQQQSQQTQYNRPHHQTAPQNFQQHYQPQMQPQQYSLHHPQSNNNSHNNQQQQHDHQQQHQLQQLQQFNLSPNSMYIQQQFHPQSQQASNTFLPPLFQHQYPTTTDALSTHYSPQYNDQL